MSGPIQSFLSSLAHLLSMHTTHAVSCSGNGGDQKQAASTLINTAQKIASQLTPAPTPTPTPQANFLNLPNIGNLQNLLGALPGNQVCARPGITFHGFLPDRPALALACAASWPYHTKMRNSALRITAHQAVPLFECMKAFCGVVLAQRMFGDVG